MKRLLPLIPIILLLFLGNSCGIPSSSVIDTAVAARLATLWTPTPTQTSDPYISTTINLLNTDLSTANPLEFILDAQYYVTKISIHPNSPTRTLQVDADCICMNETNCCIPERTFIEIVDSMKRNYGNIPSQVFLGVDYFMVVCSDHRTGKPIGAMSASWQDVLRYLQNLDRGYQLAVKVIHTAVP